MKSNFDGFLLKNENNSPIFNTDSKDKVAKQNHSNINRHPMTNKNAKYGVGLWDD